MKNFEEKMVTLLSSRNFIIYILTNEEERLEYTLNNISSKIFQKNIYTWNFIDGYNYNPNQTTKAQRNPLQALEIIENNHCLTPQIFLLKDFDNFINDLSIIRKLKNINQLLKRDQTYLIISSTESKIPIKLKEYITLVDFPLPNTKEITQEVNRLFDIFKIKNYSFYNHIISAYKGFSIEKIRKSISKIVSSKKINENILEIILEEKKQIIKQTDILEYYTRSKKLEDIGGLNNLKSWLIKRSNAFSLQAKSYGIPTPKGILLVGIQGTGKSLSAKAIAIEWDLPLLKLDMGKIFAGIVGESENRMRQMIKLCEQVAPCVLWIDEIDKIFSNNRSNNDGGTTSRVMHSFLTWLSEKNNTIFIVATANNISNLPAEILRRGRFDEIFFLNLPTFQERLNIFKIHLRRFRPLTWNQYNIYYLSKISYNFSGAEIEQAIIEAMHNAFYENREFKTQDIIDSISSLVPLASMDNGNTIKLQELANAGRIRVA
uniref:Uncharacterized AAA domain-containing protein ycf46 n=1 Tax=Plumaria plumosa TaxID=189642 RepID=A0A4D6WWX3_9FLOR|nr:hypothetical protein [Plumaria plumosa]